MYTDTYGISAPRDDRRAECSHINAPSHHLDEGRIPLVSMLHGATVQYLVSGISRDSALYAMHLFAVAVKVCHCFTCFAARQLVAIRLALPQVRFSILPLAVSGLFLRDSELSSRICVIYSRARGRDAQRKVAKAAGLETDTYIDRW